MEGDDERDRAETPVPRVAVLALLLLASNGIAPFLKPVYASASGALEVHTVPDEVKVYVSGELRANTSDYWGEATIQGLPEGTYVLKLSKAGYKDWIKQVSITSGSTTRVYAYLEAGIGNSTTRNEVISATSAALYGVLKVHTVPDEVNIYVTGEFGGTTSDYWGEATVQGLLEGIYTLKLTKAGYKSWAKQVTITRSLTTTVFAYLEAGLGNVTTRNETISPASAALSGSLKVHTVPDEVNIYVTGEFGGTTSDYWGEATVQGLMEGTYVLKLSKAGYKDWVKQVSISASLTTTVYASLETGIGNSTTRNETISAASVSLFGTLELHTYGDVSVYVSGEPGGVTDHWNGIGTVQGILEGTYVLKLTKNGYKDWVKQVSFGAGLTTTVYAYLETGTGNATTRDEVISPASLLGSLEVDTTPKGVNIYVGGEFGGTTDSRGATVQGIPEGTYVLRLRKAGYQDWVAQVNVTAGLTTTVKATLALLQCKADFSVDLTRVPVGAAVRFTDLSTGSVESWLWDFGDGQTSTERNPTHIYRRDGTYTVSLIVSNKAGNNTVRKERYVTVYDKPHADFSFSPAQIAVGNSISFTDRSTGTVASWLWDFGDGSTSTEQNPIHFYRTGGNYTVSLTASNLAGSDTVRKERCIAVYTKPHAAFTFTPAEVTAGGAVSFRDESVGSITSWLWDFGDGSTSTEQNPVHIYRTEGNYTVSLTASNLAGSDTMRKERCVRVYASEFASTILTISVASVLMAAYAVILRTALRRNPEPKASPDRT